MEGLINHDGNVECDLQGGRHTEFLDGHLVHLTRKPLLAICKIKVATTIGDNLTRKPWIHGNLTIEDYHL